MPEMSLKQGAERPLKANKFNANIVMARLQAGNVFNVAGAKDRSVYFEPCSPEYDYRPERYSLVDNRLPDPPAMPDYDYIAEIYAAPAQGACRPEQISFANAAVTEFLGEPDAAYPMTVSDFNDIDPELQEMYKYAHPGMPNGITTQRMIVPGQFRYVRQIGTATMSHSNAFSIRSLRERDLPRDTFQITETPIQGAFDVFLYPTLSIAREAAKSTLANARAHLLLVLPRASERPGSMTQ